MNSSDIVEHVLNHKNFVFDRKLQRNEEDTVPLSEKQLHLSSLLSRSPSLFLERFGNCLSESEKCWFAALGDADVSLILGNRYGTARNRRLAYLRTAGMRRDEYFALESMRLRDPALYTQLVGDDRDEAFADDVTLPDRIYQSYNIARACELEEERRAADALANADNSDDDQTNPNELNDEAAELIRRALSMRAAQNKQMRTGDTSMAVDQRGVPKKRVRAELSDTRAAKDRLVVVGDDDQAAAVRAPVVVPMSDSDAPDDREAASAAALARFDKDDRIEAFRRVMNERWLFGLESAFDYSKIDNDQSLDVLEVINQDLEDHYFDEDE